MAGITLAQAEAKLTTWMAVLDDIAANGQQTAILGRQFQAASLADAQQQVDFWDKKIKQLSAASTGGIRVRGLTAG